MRSLDRNLESGLDQQRTEGRAGITMATAPVGTFRRGLDRPFAELLSQGTLRPLMDAVRADGLDLQVRDNYVDIYSGGNSILNLQYLPRLRRFRAAVHRKFNPPAGFVSKDGNDYAEASFAFDEATGWAGAYIDSLPQLRLASAQYNKAEGLAEFGIVRANCQAPFLVLDRQVQLEGYRDSRVDVLGLTLEASSPKVVLLELKYGLRLDPDVLGQIDRYRHYYEQNGSLRPDVADCLDEILVLKRELGMLQATLPCPLRELPIDFLVVLVAAGVETLPPPQTIEGLDRIHYLGLGMDDLRIPEREHWKILRGT